ncbi:hypothetical protein GCM10022243_47240 [Saccharothrix violaceirubra]|uniref:Uncharacterized protein n=1 Tax=Saccharothrix violaceirubra TaxID=413306 RepID=A0A7W7T719_9PSEU|nr:hypothetical protein [Saccharothrix violaceirubra]
MGLLDALRRRLARGAVPTLAIDSPGLRVVVTAFDLVEADSAVLARSPEWDPAADAVLRHHLELPADQVQRARELLAPDGWELREGSPAYALRVQKLDVLGCARERSRMAGLAQRLGGDWIGWDALQVCRGNADNIVATWHPTRRRTADERATDQDPGVQPPPRGA